MRARRGKYRRGERWEREGGHNYRAGGMEVGERSIPQYISLSFMRIHEFR